MWKHGIKLVTFLGFHPAEFNLLIIKGTSAVCESDFQKLVTMDLAVAFSMFGVIELKQSVSTDGIKIVTGLTL
jgi:hypothetical protein